MGEVALMTGEWPGRLYIVLAGQFLVLRNDSAARLGPGDLTSETALLSGGAVKSTASPAHPVNIGR
jgi:CRP-like cAMP-binding protein